MRIHGLAALALVGGVALAACGSSGSSTASSAYSASPVVSSANATTVKTGSTSLGPVLVDAQGHTLYGLTKDMNGSSTCDGACAIAWPPLTVGSASLPAGLDATLFSVITRADGTHQLKAGKWPLYRFSGDAKAGDVNGQGTAGFFAVSPNGKLHK